MLSLLQFRRVNRCQCGGMAAQSLFQIPVRQSVPVRWHGSLVSLFFSSRHSFFLFCSLSLNCCEVSCIGWM